MAVTPLRLLAFIFGTPQTQGTPAWFGISYEALCFYVMLGVWRWRRWAVLAWTANTAFTLAIALATGDRMMLIHGAVQAAVIFFVVRPIWSNFR